VNYVEQSVFRGGCFFAAASLEFDSRPGRVRDDVFALTKAWMDALRQEIAFAKWQHEIAPATVPSQLAFELHAYVQEVNWVYKLLGDKKAFLTGARSDRLQNSLRLAGAVRREFESKGPNHERTNIRSTTTTSESSTWECTVFDPLRCWHSHGESNLGRISGTPKGRRSHGAGNRTVGLRGLAALECETRNNPNCRSLGCSDSRHSVGGRELRVGVRRNAEHWWQMDRGVCGGDGVPVWLDAMARLTQDRAEQARGIVARLTNR